MDRIAGASYRFLGTLVSADLIYGSGLRQGFANTDHVAPYTQVNLGLSREFSTPWGKPVTLRFDVVNLLDYPTSFAAAPASACSPRNMARAAGYSRG